MTLRPGIRDSTTRARTSSSTSFEAGASDKIALLPAGYTSSAQIGGDDNDDVKALAHYIIAYYRSSKGIRERSLDLETLDSIQGFCGRTARNLQRARVVL